MYKVIGSRKTRALRVIWFMEELGEPYELVAAAPRSDEVRAVNPLGKVPVLQEGDMAICDSTAIMTYLADKHGRLTRPAGTLERAAQDSLTHFLLDEFDACLWTAARHSFVLPEEWRHPEIKPSLKWEFERSVEHFSKRLGENAFLLGEELTIPDIIAAHCLRWAIGAKFPVGPENVRSYLLRMTERPAFQRAAGERGAV